MKRDMDEVRPSVDNVITNVYSFRNGSLIMLRIGSTATIMFVNRMSKLDLLFYLFFVKKEGKKPFLAA